MPVSEVTSADVLVILTLLWHTKGPPARLVHMRVRAVMERTIAMDWRTDNLAASRPTRRVPCGLLWPWRRPPRPSP